MTKKFKFQRIVELQNTFKAFSNKILNKDKDPTVLFKKMVHLKQLLESFGQPITDQTLLAQLVYSLPESYDTIKSKFVNTDTFTLEQFQDSTIDHHLLLMERKRTTSCPSYPIK